MCALDAAEITAVSFLGEVGEEAHHALSKMSAAKAIAGGEMSALLFATHLRSIQLLGKQPTAPQGLLLCLQEQRVWVSKDAAWIQG